MLEFVRKVSVCVTVNVSVNEYQHIFVSVTECGWSVRVSVSQSKCESLWVSMKECQCE